MLVRAQAASNYKTKNMSGHPEENKLLILSEHDIMYMKDILGLYRHLIQNKHCL